MKNFCSAIEACREGRPAFEHFCKINAIVRDIVDQPETEPGVRAAIDQLVFFFDRGDVSEETILVLRPCGSDKRVEIGLQVVEVRLVDGRIEQFGEEIPFLQNGKRPILPRGKRAAIAATSTTTAPARDRAGSPSGRTGFPTSTASCNNQRT